MLRIRSEEKLLREVFGKEFEEYARHALALLPFGTQRSNDFNSQ
jgi:protein-S-isoprenylcysteine O-methyltransferase Ste14